MASCQGRNSNNLFDSSRGTRRRRKLSSRLLIGEQSNVGARPLVRCLLLFCLLLNVPDLKVDVRNDDEGMGQNGFGSLEGSSGGGDWHQFALTLDDGLSHSTAAVWPMIVLGQ